MKVEIDDKSGFCFGVVGAISLAERSLAEGKKVWSLGDIVHNRVEMERLAALGLATADHTRLNDMRGETVLIRAHGEPPPTYEIAEKNAIDIIDATCPVVARLQKIVAEARRTMNETGGQVVILGKKGHAEVVGLTGQIEGNAAVVESVEDLAVLDFNRPIYLLSQTTQSLSLFGKVADEIRKRAADPAQVTVHDTICRQVANREQHLEEFAGRHDVIIFVSGRKSSNGKVLFGVCLRANPRSYMIEDETELLAEWLEGAGSIGVCGATSTPRWLMERVAGAINSC